MSRMVAQLLIEEQALLVEVTEAMGRLEGALVLMHLLVIRVIVRVEAQGQHPDIAELPEATPRGIMEVLEAVHRHEQAQQQDLLERIIARVKARMAIDLQLEHYRGVAAMVNLLREVAVIDRQQEAQEAQAVSVVQVLEVQAVLVDLAVVDAPLVAVAHLAEEAGDAEIKFKII